MTLVIILFCMFYRVSPERLFLQYILDAGDQQSADTLAIVCGLDINQLYQVAAQLKLSKNDVQQAARFFQQSKVRPVPVKNLMRDKSENVKQTIPILTPLLP